MKKKLKVIVPVAAVLLIAIVLSTVFAVRLYKELASPVAFDEVAAPASGAGTGYYRHCYTELNDNEKKIYAVILRSIYEMPKRIEIPAMQEGDDLNRIFEAVSYDNPDLFCLGLFSSVYNEGQKTYFEPEYCMTREDYQTFLADVETVANGIITAAQGMTSDYEKELFVHDAIVNSCSYVAPESYQYANGIYGCLAAKTASCEGYSRAFQYIMTRLNIDTRIVTGEAADDGINYIGHMWNYVVIGGSGYYVDLTWDDPEVSGEMLRHAYFNVNSEDILLRHRNIQQNLVSTDRKFNYYIFEGAFLGQGSGDRFRTVVETAALKARNRGYTCTELRFSDANAMERAKHTLFKDGVIYDVYKEMGLISDGSASVRYSTDESLLTICLFF